MRLFKRRKKEERFQRARRSHLTDEKGKDENTEALSHLTMDEFPRLDLVEPEDLSDSTTETLEETSENINAPRRNEKKKRITRIDMKKE